MYGFQPSYARYATRRTHRQAYSRNHVQSSAQYCFAKYYFAV